MPIPTAAVSGILQLGDSHGEDDDDFDDLRSLGENLDPANRQIVRLLASRSGLLEGALAKAGKKPSWTTAGPTFMKVSP